MCWGMLPLTMKVLEAKVAPHSVMFGNQDIARWDMLENATSGRRNVSEAKVSPAQC